MRDRETALKDQEIALEKKRGDFEHEQFVRERETREFEAKQYNDLLKAKDSSGVKNSVVTGVIGTIIGLIISAFLH